MENLTYLCTITYTVASPDPNPRGGVNYLTLRVQFYANECNEGETLTPNPNECNSTLTSGTSAPIYTIYTGGGGQLPMGWTIIFLGVGYLFCKKIVCKL